MKSNTCFKMLSGRKKPSENRGGTDGPVAREKLTRKPRRKGIYRESRTRRP